MDTGKDMASTGIGPNRVRVLIEDASKGYPITMTITEGLEPSGLAMVSPSCDLGVVRRWARQQQDAV